MRPEEEGRRVTLLDPATEPVDFPRDRWQRPLIIPPNGPLIILPNGGKPVPYTRASSAAKTVEDHWNLEMWARRNVVFGMSRDASLVARALAVGGDPSTWDMPTKRLVDKIHEDAAGVAQANKGADIGTAVHRLTERLDRGEAVHAGPYEPDLEAYANALIAAGLTVVDVECRMVCDSLKLAGTADRIVKTPDGRHRILDIKTGGTVDYGALGWAAQLAGYAHGLLYDPVAGQRLPTPELDPAVGYICHLPAGKGTCTLYEIDLVAGYRAAELANEIRAIRREAKRWISPLNPDRCQHGAWCMEACPTCQGEPPAAMSRAEAVALLGYEHDEGGAMIGEHFEPLKATYADLGERAKAWFNQLTLEADRASVPFRANQTKTLRRFELYRGLLLLARGGDRDDEIVRALAAAAVGTDAPFCPDITTGHAVGAMSADQAAQFAHLAVDHIDGRLVATVHPDGNIRLSRAA
jgi:ferredoxin